MSVPTRSMAWMKAKVAAPVETCPDSCAVSAAVWLSRAAPNWNASPPAVPCAHAAQTPCRQCIVFMQCSTLYMMPLAPPHGFVLKLSSGGSWAPQGHAISKGRLCRQVVLYFLF